ncbi:MAG TPA: hypothetical protein VFG99_08475, partial [Chloroflexia bacterium]|nr:hypothetical protein [Chloroflexia bacterium]
MDFGYNRGMEQTSTVSQPVVFQPRDPRPNIYDLSPDRLSAVMAGWGEPGFRATQVLHWLYKELVTSF